MSYDLNTYTYQFSSYIIIDFLLKSHMCYLYYINIKYEFYINTIITFFSAKFNLWIKYI